MKSSIVLIATLFFYQAGFAVNYYFSTKEDNAYNNPINWTPGYPGSVIQKGDVVVFQSDAVLDGINIEVNGTIVIELGVSIFSGSNGITITKTGKMTNNGEMNMIFLDNAGYFENQSLSFLNINTCTNRKTATLNNLFSGKISGIDFVNEGEFHNYGKCFATNLSNKAQIFQYSHAHLEVNDLFEQFPNSKIIPSVFAVFNAKAVKNYSETQGSYLGAFSSSANL